MIFATSCFLHLRIVYVGGWVNKGLEKNIYLKGTVALDFLLLVFFMNQLPLIIPLGLFQFFSKIRRDIRSSSFATGVVDAIVVDTGGNLPSVSLTSVANLSQVSTTLAKMVEKFAAGVVDTGGAP